MYQSTNIVRNVLLYICTKFVNCILYVIYICYFYIIYTSLFLKHSRYILGLKNQAAPFLSISLAPLHMQDMSQYVWCDIAWTHRSSSRGHLDWRKRSSRRARRLKPWAQRGVVNACREGCSLLPLLAIPSVVLWASCLSTFSPDHARLETPFPVSLAQAPFRACAYTFITQPQSVLTLILPSPFPFSALTRAHP